MLVLTSLSAVDLDRAARSLGLQVRRSSQGRRTRGPYAGRAAWRVDLYAETLRARTRWGDARGRGRVAPTAWLAYLENLYALESDLYARSTAGTARSISEARGLAGFGYSRSTNNRPDPNE